MKQLLSGQGQRSRRGAILVLAAFFLVVIFAFAAFTVDIGFILGTKTQLQAAADAAALASAMELSGSANPATVRANARAAAVEIAGLHRNGEQDSVAINPTRDVTFGRQFWNNGQQRYQILWGDQHTPHNVVKVRAQRAASNQPENDNQLPLFFAPIMGQNKTTVAAEAIATFQPRDIVVVLDFSASMSDDSELSAINRLGRTYVESNLQTMWNELGSPNYGELHVAAAYATLAGAPKSGKNDHVDVTYRRTSVVVNSTGLLKQVKLKFSNGDTQTFTSLLGLNGTFAGTGGNAGKDITNCWVKSALSKLFGKDGEQFDFTTENIQEALGLNMSYPYPSGSWTEYIEEVQRSSGAIKDAGYRDMYGYLTWIHYLQARHPSNAETPDLWKTSEQPVTAMKDAVDEFIDYLNAVEAEDYVGLSIYTSNDAAGAVLEHGLSQNIDQIKTTTRRRQAGHYNQFTNIYAGMKVGREEMVANARPEAFRMMVLMTDGLPNLPYPNARAKVLEEANAAKAENIKILTVSLGSGADTSLMQEVADITGGLHFNVPGGTSIEVMRERLEAVFREIASSRPLKLIGG